MLNLQINRDTTHLFLILNHSKPSAETIFSLQKSLILFLGSSWRFFAYRFYIFLGKLVPRYLTILIIASNDALEVALLIDYHLCEQKQRTSVRWHPASFLNALIVWILSRFDYWVFVCYASSSSVRHCFTSFSILVCLIYLSYSISLINISNPILSSRIGSDLHALFLAFVEIHLRVYD